MELSAPEATGKALAEEALVRAVMPELDTLRGVAVLLVVLLHAFFWSYSDLVFDAWQRRVLLATQPGWIGVNLFFVLSGFLITGILLESKKRKHYYARFYVRRALRILPPYYSLLVVLLLARPQTAAFVGLSFVYLANITSFFGVVCAYGPLWSLAVEEHFYIVWPAFVRNLGMRQLQLFSMLLIVTTPIMRGVSFYLGYRSGLGSYTWFVADGLALGSLLAVILRSGVSRSYAFRLALALLGSAVAVAGLGYRFGILTRMRLVGACLQYSVVNAACAGILLLVLLVGTSRMRRLVNIGWLRFVGYLSYGLYLNHVLLLETYDWICRRYAPSLIPENFHFELVLLRFLVAGGSAIALAYLSRRYFEERFLSLKDVLVPKGD